MSEKLNAELEGMAKGIYNHLKLNVSAAALEDLGTKNRKEGNRKDWIRICLKNWREKKNIFKQVNKKDVSLENYKSKKRAIF